MQTERRCLLAASMMHVHKYLVYKIRRKTRLSGTTLFGHTYYGAWRVSFMGSIIGAGITFNEAVQRAKIALAEQNLLIERGRL